ncbi:MAG TPA: hypothetical protein VFD65_01620 [Chitinophagales bacterium]|nr:hypothetical protein [Chitinophagales bacterium]
MSANLNVIAQIWGFRDAANDALRWYYSFLSAIKFDSHWSKMKENNSNVVLKIYCGQTEVWAIMRGDFRAVD